MKRSKFSISALSLIWVLYAQACSASLVDNIPCAGKDGANCSLNDFMRFGLNAVQLIFALAGSLALLYFIYGGIMWVISAGNPEKVKQGLESIKNAAIGLVIIFASYMIINFVMTSLGYTGFGAWFTTPS